MIRIAARINLPHLIDEVPTYYLRGHQVDAGKFSFLITNTYIAIIFCFLALIALVILAFFLLGCLKVAMLQLRQKKAAIAAHLASIGPDGKPYPPSGRGLCDNCSKVVEKVYFIPSGRRLCKRCYKVHCKLTPA